MTSFTAAELYKRHAAELVRFASSMVDPAAGPDVVADVFVEIVRRQPAIDQPRPYLYRAVYNRSVSYFRRTGREVPMSDHSEFESRTVTTEQSARWLEPYLESLSEQQRAVLFLRYVEDMTPAGIARVLSVSEGSVKRQLARIHRQDRRGRSDVMIDEGSNSSDWRQLIIGYFGRRTAGVQPLAFEHVVRRAEYGENNTPPPVGASQRGRFLALVAVTLALLGIGSALTTGWWPGDGGNETVAAHDDGGAPETTEDPMATSSTEDDGRSTDSANQSVDESADTTSTGTDADDHEETDIPAGEPLSNFVVLRDASGTVDRVSIASGEILETVGSFPSLAAGNRSSDSLVEGRVQSVNPGGLDVDGQPSDVLLAVCCEPVGGNVYRLNPTNPNGTDQPTAVGTRAVPSLDGSIIVYAITGFDFVVDGVELGVELDGMVDVAWINRSGLEGLAWLDVDEARPERGVLMVATYDRDPSLASDVAEIASIELHRRSMASNGLDRLIVAGCADASCNSTQLLWIDPADGTTLAETTLDYGAMVAGVDPSGRVLLIADNGDVRLLSRFGDTTDMTDRVVATGALWAGW